MDLASLRQHMVPVQLTTTLESIFVQIAANRFSQMNVSVPIVESNYDYEKMAKRLVHFFIGLNSCKSSSVKRPNTTLII